MRIFDIMSELLGGDLSNEEMKFLKYLSPSGIAKINSDISKGIDPEITMAELRKVHFAMLERRAKVIGSLPTPIRQLVSMLKQPLSTEEMIFLVDCHQANILDNLDVTQLADLTDMSDVHLNDRFRNLVDEFGRAMTHSQLVCTTCPDDLTNSFVRCSPTAQLRSSQQKLLPEKRMLVAHLSPIVTWFSECSEYPIEISEHAGMMILSDASWMAECDDWSDGSEMDDLHRTRIYAGAKVSFCRGSKPSVKVYRHHQKRHVRFQIDPQSPPMFATQEEPEHRTQYTGADEAATASAHNYFATEELSSLKGQPTRLDSTTVAEDGHISPSSADRRPSLRKTLSSFFKKASQPNTTIRSLFVHA